MGGIKMYNRDELEDIYQDIAGIIGEKNYMFKIDDTQYPRLIIEDITNKEKYEIIMKKIR
jgi:hypothetical protein